MATAIYETTSDLTDTSLLPLEDSVDLSRQITKCINNTKMGIPELIECFGYEAVREHLAARDNELLKVLHVGRTGIRRYDAA